MNFLSVKKEIRELRNSLLYKNEPSCKAFIMGAKDSPTEAEINEYRRAHPLTRVIKLTRKSCGKEDMQ